MREPAVVGIDPWCGIKKELYRYQEEGVMFALRNKKVIIADEMGLGKTIQALTFLHLRKDLRPAVIVCPVKLDWAAQIDEALPDIPENRYQVLYGTRPYTTTKPILILNYDILNDWLPELIRVRPRALVLDESHLIKNRQAQRTKAVYQLKKACNPEAILCLTGTPLLNRPIELWTQLNLLAPEEFGNYIQFGKRYCAGRQKTIFARGGYIRTVWDFSGASNLDELRNRIMGRIMIRRLKKDVLPELPPKTVVTVPLELSNEEEYLHAERQFLMWLAEQVRQGRYDWHRLMTAMRAEALVHIEYLKQCAARLKLPAALQWIDTALESGEKLVVFAHHREIIDQVAEHIPDSVIVTGDCTAEQRKEAVTRFQTAPNCRVFIGSLQSAGIALTLTAASNVVFLEYPWRPADMDQAADRTHRIGQDEPVTVWCLVGKVSNGTTVEERILAKLGIKRQTERALLNPDGDSDALGAVLAEYANLTVGGAKLC